MLKKRQRISPVLFFYHSANIWNLCAISLNRLLVAEDSLQSSLRQYCAKSQILGIFAVFFWSVGEALGQALVPHTLQLNSTQLNSKGWAWREAAQLAHSQQYELVFYKSAGNSAGPQKLLMWFLLGGSVFVNE